MLTAMNKKHECQVDKRRHYTQTGRQTDRWTDGMTGRQTDTETDKNTNN